MFLPDANINRRRTKKNPPIEHAQLHMASSRTGNINIKIPKISKNAEAPCLYILGSGNSEDLDLTRCFTTAKMLSPEQKSQCQQKVFSTCKFYINKIKGLQYKYKSLSFADFKAHA